MLWMKSILQIRFSGRSWKLWGIYSIIDEMGYSL